jgi:hypothetical protein
MKLKATVITLTAALGLTISAQTQDIVLNHLDEQPFRDAGLYFWTTPNPPHNIPVNYLKGGDSGGQMRIFVCIGHLGSSEAIYCVNGPNERDDTLNLLAFLEGYKIAASPDQRPHYETPAQVMGISEEELDRQVDEAGRRLDAIIAMNWGKLPANWPTGSTDPTLNPSEEQWLVWERKAQQRLDAIRTAHGGQLPADWKTLVQPLNWQELNDLNKTTPVTRLNQEQATVAMNNLQDALGKPRINGHVWYEAESDTYNWFGPKSHQHMSMPGTQFMAEVATHL